MYRKHSDCMLPEKYYRDQYFICVFVCMDMFIKFIFILCTKNAA